MGERSPAPRSRSTLVAVAAILTLALALRVTAVFVASGFPPCCDADDYIRHGRSIAAGDGYPRSVLTPAQGPTALRPPLYPLFIAAVLTVSGSRLKAVRLAQAVAGTFAVALLGLIAWQIYRRRTVALAALGLGAVYPPLVLFPTSFLSESLFLALELAALAAAWAARDHGARYRFAILAGLMVGLSWLTREVGALMLIPVVAVLVTAPSIAWRQRWRHALIAVAVAAVTVTPWTIRNAITMDAFIPVGLQNGLQLSGVYNEESRTARRLQGAWRPPTTVERDAPLFAQHITEVELDRRLTRNAIDYARDHPGYVVTATVKNGLRMLHLGGAASEDLVKYSLNLSPRLVRVDRIGFYVAALLAIAGIFTRAFRRVPWWFWLAPIAFFAVAAVTAGLARYRIPADPYVLLAAAPAVATLAVRPRARSENEG